MMQSIRFSGTFTHDKYELGQRVEVDHAVKKFRRRFEQLPKSVEVKVIEGPSSTLSGMSKARVEEPNTEFVRYQFQRKQGGFMWDTIALPRLDNPNAPLKEKRARMNQLMKQAYEYIRELTERYQAR